MSILMSRDSNPGNATVTLCHSKTENLKEIAKQADILIVALGRPEFIDASYVKKGACVIDVGVSRVPDSTRKSGYKIVGDVKFDEVSKVADAITPVPGGVGPMTIAALLQNTLRSYKRQEGITQSCK
jgi:methylenetetrahydrofolate dehydrogenase (NADP+)/methenyltetrahydrofolate cyclohydrolase